MISGIIKQLNESICGCFPSAKMFGLTSLMRRENITIPCVIDENGEGLPIAPDDQFEMMAYHRLNSISSAAATVTKSYGDNISAFQNIAQLSAFVYFNRSKTGKNPDDIYLTIQAAITRLIQQANPLIQYQVSVVSASFNDLTTWNAEFGTAVTYKLNPNSNFIQINYSITMLFDVSCFKCDC